MKKTLTNKVNQEPQGSYEFVDQFGRTHVYPGWEMIPEYKYYPGLGFTHSGFNASGSYVLGPGQQYVYTGDDLRVGGDWAGTGFVDPKTGRGVYRTITGPGHKIYFNSRYEYDPTISQDSLRNVYRQIEADPRTLPDKTVVFGIK